MRYGSTCTTYHVCKCVIENETSSTHYTPMYVCMYVSGKSSCNAKLDQYTCVQL